MVYHTSSPIILVEGASVHENWWIMSGKLCTYLWKCTSKFVLIIHEGENAREVER